MRSLIAIFVVAFAAVAPAAAQEPGHVDVFAGYGYLRQHPGGVNLNGAEASVSYGIFPHLAVEGSVAAHFGSKSDERVTEGDQPAGVGLVGLNNRSYAARIRRYDALVGPRVSAGTGKVAVFAHALFGVTRSTVASTVSGFGDTIDYPPGVPPYPFTYSVRRTDDAFATKFGGGLDVRVSDRVTFRAAQVDYVRAHLFSDSENDIAVSTGLVFRF